MTPSHPAVPTQAEAQEATAWFERTAGVKHPQEIAHVETIRAALSALAHPVAAEQADSRVISYDKHEQEMLHCIDQRDQAQDAISQAYYVVTGHSPEWSNKFGYEDALEDIGDTVAVLKKAATPGMSSEGREAVDGPIGYANLGDAESDTHLVTIRELKGQHPKDYFGHRRYYAVYTAPPSAPLPDGLTLELARAVTDITKAYTLSGQYSGAIEDAEKRNAATIKIAEEIAGGKRDVD